MSRFDYFVVLAGMRTGSNLLQEQLNAMPGIVCHGELFNPHFIGRPGVESAFGLSIAAREADPVRLIGAVRSAGGGLNGFRLFHDHDPRAIAHVVDDPRAAKIILTRRPLDSYVSLKIARKTDQWWLGDLTTARAARVAFDTEEYARFLDTLSEFQAFATRRLQVTGQAAFRIGYDDLADDEILKGLASFLGAGGPPDASKVRAKVQNPTPLADRLINPAEAADMLARLEAPDLGHVPLHEPGRGPGLRLFRACESAPLLYMPIRGAGDDPVPRWLASCDPGGKVLQGMTQKDMRRWKRRNPGHRSFTVLRHPFARVHDAFCRLILSAENDAYADMRDALAKRYGLDLPAGGPGPEHTLERHRHLFGRFLEWLRGNLGGQTALRVDNTWATQSVLLQAIGQFSVPDRVVREDSMSADLARLAIEAGVGGGAAVSAYPESAPFPAGAVWTADLEAACEAAYRRDYMMFGFRPFSSARQAA